MAQVELDFSDRINLSTAICHTVEHLFRTAFLPYAKGAYATTTRQQPIAGLQDVIMAYTDAIIEILDRMYELLRNLSADGIEQPIQKGL